MHSGGRGAGLLFSRRQHHRRAEETGDGDHRGTRTARAGIYCGAIGWLGFNGESQFNIAIRTLVREGGRVSYDVGGGIVADSDPQKEYEETLHKAAGIRLAVARWEAGGALPGD